MDVGTLQEFEGIFLTPAELKELKAFGRNQTLPHGNSKTLLDYGLVANNFGASFSDGDSIGNPGCHITPKGERYLCYLEKSQDDMRQKHTEEKAEKTVEHRFQLINTLIGAIAGSLFTLFIEHFPEITAFILKFIRSIGHLPA